MLSYSMDLANLLLAWQGFATDAPRNALARRLHDLITSGLCSSQVANAHVYILYLRQEHFVVIVTVVMRRPTSFRLAIIAELQVHVP